MIYNYIVRILCDDREDNMDLYSFIEEAIFEEKDKYTRLYELIWSEFEQDGFVVTLGNWLNGRMSLGDLEQLWCELIVPEQETTFD